MATEIGPAPTMVTAQALQSDLARTKDGSFSIDDCEHQANVRCVAAPIRNTSGTVFASISVTGPPEHMSDARLPVLAELVVETADTISERLGWKPAAAQRGARVT